MLVVGGLQVHGICSHILGCTKKWLMLNQTIRNLASGDLASNPIEKDFHFIKEYLEQFSKFAFQEVACPVGQPRRQVLEILLARRHTLVIQNHQASVRLHHS